MNKLIKRASLLLTIPITSSVLPIVSQASTASISLDVSWQDDVNYTTTDSAIYLLERELTDIVFTSDEVSSSSSARSEIQNIIDIILKARDYDDYISYYIDRINYIAPTSSANGRYIYIVEIYYPDGQSAETSRLTAYIEYDSTGSQLVTYDNNTTVSSGKQLEWFSSVTAYDPTASYSHLGLVISEVTKYTSNPFTDVSHNDWFFDVVMEVNARELMTGYTSTMFGPDMTCSRAMVASILHRMVGSPDWDSDIRDVSGDEWYSDAAMWAVDNDVFDLRGSYFYGNSAITRQELVTTLYNFAKYNNLDTVGVANLYQFSDMNLISDTDAARWAVGMGLINGKPDNLFDPYGTATRAEIAAVLSRFIEYLDRQ